VFACVCFAGCKPKTDQYVSFWNQNPDTADFDAPVKAAGAFNPQWAHQRSLEEEGKDVWSADFLFTILVQTSKLTAEQKKNRAAHALDIIQANQERQRANKKQQVQDDLGKQAVKALFAAN
jgi:hypothetical protein